MSEFNYMVYGCVYDNIDRIGWGILWDCVSVYELYKSYHGPKYEMSDIINRLRRSVKERIINIV